MEYKLEICTDNILSAIDAQEAGANRIELCDSLIEGGTTPGHGAISTARSKLGPGLHVIIRPRGGDFLYSDLEYEIMKKDIVFCRSWGVDGIVTGILKSDGSIDTNRTSELARLAWPMSVTFHRAFDVCKDPVKSLEDVIATGAQRLLTSGQEDNAANGAALIRKLVELSGKRIIIMPGSGLTESNIESVARQTGALEFHLTGRKTIESGMSFRKEGIKMGEKSGISEFQRKVADIEVIKRIIIILKSM
jgi:copper homeostasis protein